MQYNIHTLRNGLRVALIPMEGTETATVVVMTGTGSRFENERENGLAHFLEHMFFKGTAKRPTARSISEELDAVGSQYNAFTAKDRTAYWAKVDRRHLDTAIDVISDIFLNSRLPSAEIAKERGAVIQEIDMYEDMPMRSVDNIFEALLYGADHPLGRTILGPKENIRAFTRKDFSRYHKRNYVPANTVVCVAGAFSNRAVLSRIQHDFGKLAASDAPSYVPFIRTQNAPRAAIKDKKTDQTQLMLGVPAYPFLHKDEYALDVLAAVLGGGMSSRLFHEVREKRGLAYSVHAWVDKFPDTGYVAVQAGVEHGKLEKALTTILSEFRKIRRTPVPAGELAKAKEHIKGTLTLSLETSDEIAVNASSSLIHLNRVRPLEEIARGIDAVAARDVQRVACDLLRTESLNLAVIGPHADNARLHTMLRV